MGTGDCSPHPLVKVMLGVEGEAVEGRIGGSTAVETEQEVWSVQPGVCVRVYTSLLFCTLFFRMKGHSFLLCLLPSVRLSR